MDAEASHAGGQGRVAGDGQPRIPISPEVLGRVEAEAAHHAQAAGPLVLVLRAERLGGVLDHAHVMAGCDVEHSVEVARDVLEVHRDDRGRPVGHMGGEVGAIESERVVDLREHRHGPGRDDRVHGRDERERGDDDLVAASHPQRRERAPQRGSSVRDRDRVPSAECVARRALEAGYRACRRPSRIAKERPAGDHRGDRVGFGLPEQRGALGEVEGLGPHRSPAVDGEHAVVWEHPRIVPRALTAQHEGPRRPDPPSQSS